MTILVSACLVGLCTRYDGGASACPEVTALAKRHTLIPVCPEQLGGLKTPRPPAERRADDGRVFTRDGKDVTEQFSLGARLAEDIFRLSRADMAVLKARSPSCGAGKIYDGTFLGRLVPLSGLFAEKLLSQGVPVLTEENTDALKALL